jgi:hypothetical protein
MVELPSRWVISETRASGIGDCWFCTKHLDAQRHWQMISLVAAAAWDD